MSGIFINGLWKENTDMRCLRCHSPVWEADNPEYAYQCLACDEDMLRCECEEQDGLYLPRVAIGRNAGGITLNGEIEFILDASGDPRVFDNQPEAEGFLLQNGITEEDMEFLYFIEVDNQPDWKGEAE